MSTELTVLDRAKKALRSTEHEPALVELAKQAADITAIKNADGRTQVHGAYMVLKNRRGDIRKAGKAARDDATQFSKAVIAEEDRLVAIIEPEETRLLTLREGWDTAVEAERREKAQAAQRRKDEIRAKVDELRAIPVNLVDAAPDRIANAIADVEAFEVIAAEFDDQVDAAHLARTGVLSRLRDMHAIAVRRIEEAAQLAAERVEFDRQRAEQAERDRVAAAARAEQERKDREAREAEEAQRREAQRVADEAMRAEREEHQKRMATEREEFDHQQREAARTAAAMQEIQGIQQQVIIATAGRAGVRAGGTIQCIRATLAETEAWQIDAERFGILLGTAESAKSSAVTSIKRLLADAEQKESDAQLAAARQRAEEEAAEAERRAQADREAAERRAREAAETAVRNAAPALLDLLNGIVVLCEESGEPVDGFAFRERIIRARGLIATLRQTEAHKEAA